MALLRLIPSLTVSDTHYGNLPTASYSMQSFKLRGTVIVFIACFVCLFSIYFEWACQGF